MMWSYLSAALWRPAAYATKLFTSTSSPSTYLSVRVEDSEAKDQLPFQKRTLKEFVFSKCPSLFRPFYPTWWLNNGHSQTIYCVMGDFSKIDKVVYERQLLRLKDGGTIGLDFTPTTSERTLPDDTPVVVVLHGLTGGSHESYVRSILSPAITPKEEGGLGMRGIVVNFRGCAGVPLTTAQLYSAGHTDDIRQALIYINKKYPNAPLIGIGFSLGANVLVRYLGEEGDRSRLRSGCALACPWDLTANSIRLEGSYFYREAYSKAMAKNLMVLIKRHEKTLSTFPPNALYENMPTVFSAKSVHLSFFDRYMTGVAGGSNAPYGPFPFKSEWDYYAWASSHQSLKDVRVPLLTINSEDDPIVREVPIDCNGNEFVAIALTPGGGHLGWWETDYQSKERFAVKRWISKPVLEWLRATAEDIDVQALALKAPEIREVDGWVTEVGREHLGYKELEGGEIVVGVEGEDGLLAGL